MELNKLVIDARTRKGLSRRKLADLIGYTESAVRHIESGKTKKPSLDVIEALSAVLEIPLESLTGRTEYKSAVFGYDEVKRQAQALPKSEKVKLIQVLVEEL